jgi:hypothetical protein
MPIRIYYQNEQSQPCTIRPTPLVSIGSNFNKNGAGENIGTVYTITLTGTLLADKGSPYATGYDFIENLSPAPSFIGPFNAFDSNLSHTASNKPPMQNIPVNQAAYAIFKKQQALRSLFSIDGQKIEITDIDNDLPAITFYPRTVNIDFQENIYVEKCDYTITLECDSIYKDESEIPEIAPSGNAFISDFNEDWSIEIDEAQSESINLPRTYRITHNLSATGKTSYIPTATGVMKMQAWQEAKKFVLGKICDNATDFNCYPNIFGKIGSGTLNLISAYRGFNHVRNEQLSESAGTYSITETWLLASGTAYETFNLSLSSSIDAPFVSVSLDGTIKGLTEFSASGFGGNANNIGKKSAYDNALLKYNQISNNGQFGLTSDVYKRANNSVAVQLNSQPRSISLGSNQFTGELTYNLQFDNRPTNIISGVLSETISINDTYPGDIFAVIPVLGRKTGPVLQYIGGRSEYRRDISINLTMDYTKVPYGSTRSTILLQKPSVIEPTATQLAQLINELSPANEPGIRKYFISAPTESWNPKEGTYSMNLGWTYELDK